MSRIAISFIGYGLGALAAIHFHAAGYPLAVAAILFLIAFSGPLGLWFERFIARREVVDPAVVHDLHRRLYNREGHELEPLSEWRTS